MHTTRLASHDAEYDDLYISRSLFNKTIFLILVLFAWCSSTFKVIEICHQRCETRRSDVRENRRIHARIQIDALSRCEQSKICTTELERKSQRRPFWLGLYPLL